ncbi:ATP-binding protein [Xanthomonas protegens]|uniref:ATP-binding protein n=1 Tax=Xanthomonas protegens TaxID=3380705 RepID=A0ABU9LFE1_9XANT
METNEFDPVPDVGFIERQSELAKYLGNPDDAGKPIKTHLQASDRVIARVTDGIYREPASALRELISNAWDADARNVSILTDAPRFGRIYVRDDGNGMTFETLSHLVKNIGGSAKRNAKGQELGVTGGDTDVSPGGRQLIGKIGIGLFSVSQLARRFRIITKVRGADYRLIAEVSLRTYAEDGDEYDHAESESDDRYITGIVEIVRQKAEDLDSHGTDLILEEIKPRVRNILRDADRWALIREKDEALLRGDKEAANAIRVNRPAFHVGNMAPTTHGDVATIAEAPKLPWKENDQEDVRMSILMDEVERESGKSNRADISSTLDAYLNMLWTLGLSAPVRYVDRHPYDLTASDNIQLYWISNEQRGQATHVLMENGETVREAIHRRGPGNHRLLDGQEQGQGGFRVVIDGVEIKRPIRYKFIPAGEKNISNSLLLVGAYNPNLSKISESKRGGSLDLEAYAFWTGRIIPKENNGVLVRIRGASGAAFDSTFFGYQVSELTRLRQITSEIFIRRGLDAALNIDRESFNFSHPHVQLVASWLQRTIRQLTNKHKDLAAKQRKARVEVDIGKELTELHQHVKSVWAERQADDIPPSVTIADDLAVEAARFEGRVAISRKILGRVKSLSTLPLDQGDGKVEALVQVLLAYEVLQSMSFDDQEGLIKAILQVFYGAKE